MKNHKKIVLFVSQFFIVFYSYSQCTVHETLKLTTNNNILLIEHDSVILDCLAEMEFNIELRNDTIDLYEINTNIAYDCGMKFEDFNIQLIFYNAGYYILNIFLRPDSDVNNDTLFCFQENFTISYEPEYDTTLIVNPYAVPDTHTVNIPEKPLDETFYVSQNAPNPFSGTTRIDLFVPHSIKESYLYFYDLQGRQINRIQLRERGNFSLQLTDVLLPGTYFYSMVNDNQRVGVKKMVVVK